jgi:polyisoprenoid-binding protein YceI
MLFRVLALVSLALLPTAASAQSVTWTIDPAHSSAQFAVRHMLVSTVRGEFDAPTGTISFDPRNIAGTLKVDATIDARTISTRNEARDRDLKGAGFFEVAKFPTIKFLSKRAEAAGTGKYKVTGDLTMHGVTKEVVLDVEGPTPAVKDLSGRMRAGASITTTLNRRQFGLQYNELLEAGGAVVSDEVKVTIDLEFTQAIQFAK